MFQRNDDESSTNIFLEQFEVDRSGSKWYFCIDCLKNSIEIETEWPKILKEILDISIEIKLRW